MRQSGSVAVGLSVCDGSLTVLAERGPDLDGSQVLEEGLEVGGGQLRLPAAARLLVQPDVT